MKKISTLLAAVIAIASAQALAETKVDLKDSGQSQAGGLLNKQEMQMGNVKGGGKSDVKAKNVKQSQAGGLLNKQEMNVGNQEK